MDEALKQRLIGAIVLIALGIIFIPIMLDGPPSDHETAFDLDVKEAPETHFRTRILPIDASSADQDDPPESLSQSSPNDSPPRNSINDSNPRTQLTDVKVNDTRELESAKLDEPKASTDAPLQDNTSVTESLPETAVEPRVITSQPKEQVPTPDRDLVIDAVKKDQALETAPALAGWVVQVGSFLQQSNALQLRDKLRNKQFDAFVETLTVDRKTVFRVKIGPQIKRDSALVIRSRLKKVLAMDGFVVSHPE